MFGFMSIFLLLFCLPVGVIIFFINSFNKGVIETKTGLSLCIMLILIPWFMVIHAIFEN